MIFLCCALLGGDCHQVQQIQQVIAQPLAVQYATVPYAPVYWTYTVGQDEQIRELKNAVSELTTISKQNQQIIQQLRSTPSATNEGVSLVTQNARKVLDNSCVRCHSGDKPKGGINLTGPILTADRLLIEEVVRTGAMPPKPEKEVSDEDFAAIEAWAREDSKAVRNMLRQKGKVGAQ